MCATPAQHRAERVFDHPTHGSGFWAAKALLDPAAPGRSPKHARKTSPRYAAYVGRVGALAVSLGVGLAVAHSPAVAYASPDSDSDSDSSSSAATNETPSESTGTSSSSGDSPAAKPRSPKRAPKAKVDSSGGAVTSASRGVKKARAEAAADTPTDADSNSDTHAGNGSGPAESTAQSAAVTETSPSGMNSGGAVAAAAPVHRIEKNLLAQNRVATAEKVAVPGDEVSAPADEAAPPAAVTEAVVDTVPVNTVATVASVAPPAQDAATSVNPVSAFVSALLTPLVNPVAPAAPVENPVLSVFLAWLRREITHTFFNKTPVVGQITTTQILPGTVLIDLHESDPNGDPLSYTFESERGAIVVRDPITGKFVYQTTEIATGSGFVDNVKITISDSAQTHLTGTLGVIQGVLEGLARLLGLAQPDDLTVTVPVTVTPWIQVPPTVAPIGAPIYQVGGDPVKLLSLVEILDPDSTHLTSAKVTIGLGFNPGDTLNYAQPQDNPIQGVYDAGDGTLTLTGTATLAQYEEALKAITFSTTAGDFLSARTVSIVATDTEDQTTLIPGTVLVGVIAAGLPPSVLAVSTPVYTVGGDPVKLISGIGSLVEILDLDSSYLQGAKVSIGLGFKPGDTLNYVQPENNPITGSYDAVSGVLTLTGQGTTSQYEDAIEAITFSTTAGDFLSARTVSIAVIDEDGISSLPPGVVLVGVVGITAPPTVVPVGAPIYSVGNQPVKVISLVEILDPDSSTLQSAKVTISLGLTSGDTLGYVQPQNNPVTASYDSSTGTLTLSGTGTLAQYEEALKAVTFATTSQSVASLLGRTLTVVVTDDTGQENLIPGVVPVVVLPSINLAPVVWAPVLDLTPYTTGNLPEKLAPGLLITDDSSSLTGATVKIVAGLASGDKLGFTIPPGSTISGSYNAATGTLTFTGAGTLAQYQQLLRSVTFETTSSPGILGSARTVSFEVVDVGGATSISLPLTFGVGANSTPIVTSSIINVIPYLSGISGNLTVDPLMLVLDDSSYVTGATVKITSGKKGNDKLSVTMPAGSAITVVGYNSSTGVLTLTGNASVDDYAAVLRSVKFSTSGLFNLGTRNVQVAVTDKQGATGSSAILLINVL